MVISGMNRGIQILILRYIQEDALQERLNFQLRDSKEKNELDQ